MKSEMWGRGPCQVVTHVMLPTFTGVANELQGSDLGRGIHTPRDCCMLYVRARIAGTLSAHP